ncbi:Carboxylic ester hydrolase [Methylocella tundrae]|uniref:Carboxylic ester hydrolase n=2 Tax=Methylocella tundrae TaxID=227605 RepID=A0A4U8Z354_METTU|nr:Carboxylic ester hydrolase [Methylocella tundrae]
MFKLSKLWRSAPLRADTSRRSRKINLGLSLIFAAGAMCASWHGAAAAPGPIVTTKEGRVQGFVQNGVAQFLGVPFAEPPVGNLRWRPPRKHAPWTSVLKATSYAPICAQITTLGVFAGPANNNEDCLYLNVFTPNLDPSARLPVVFWIHGGGNFDGETPGYDGSKLAAQGHTVVVSVEYRLNLMGWLAHPALDAEGHLFGNYGILDQQLALKWVKHNIAQFGGDKNNVTVGGQSAGAVDTGIAMVSPLAAGLFHRAICESFCPSTVPTLASAEATGVAFSVAAGCGSGTDAATAKCLRSLTAAQVEALAGTASATSQYIVGPMQDGTVIPEQPITAFANGHFNHVPLINGNVEDEQNFSLAITEYFSGPPRTPPTAAQYLNYVNTTFVPPRYPAGSAAKVLVRYPLSAFATPQLAWDRVGTDVGICGQRRIDRVLAPQIPVYAYEFSDQTAPFYFPKMPGFLSLAYHTADIQYLFPLWHGGPDGIQHPLNNKQEDLSDQLVAAWTNFAWTGNPNGLGNYPWPRYTNNAVKPAWLIEDLPVLSTLTDTQYSALRKCNFWDSLTVTN